MLDYSELNILVGLLVDDDLIPKDLRLDLNRDLDRLQILNCDVKHLYLPERQLGRDVYKVGGATEALTETASRYSRSSVIGSWHNLKKRDFLHAGKQKVAG